MKKILKFKYPCDEELYKDYEAGLAALYVLHEWLQTTKRNLEAQKMTGWEVFDSLNNALQDVPIFR